MSVPAPREEATAADPVPVALARVEAKLDVALGQQHDHETRLRALEGHSTVTWKQLWAAVASATGVLAVVSPLIQQLYALHH